MYFNPFVLRLIGAVTFLFAFSSHAQVTISVKVAEKENKEPIPFTQVAFRSVTDSVLVAVVLGIRKRVQHGKGAFFINATDLFNTLVIRKTIQGNGFHYTSTDYYETQVVRVGYTYSW